MDWYIKCFSNYAVFSGRARRKEYWMFALFNYIFSFAAGILDNILLMIGFPLFIFTTLYSLAVLIPSLAVSIRRLHDTGKSGWMLLIGLIPIVGGIVLIVFMATEGTRGANVYGGDPKGGTGGYGEYYQRNNVYDNPSGFGGDSDMIL